MTADGLPFHVVDVFTDRPYAGNPLAVVLDADDLPDTALQAIAREFHLSETAFPLRASAAEQAAGADYRLRIFTPVAELPFAGHPSVGAAWVMARLGRIAAGPVHQACGAGVLPLQVAADGAEVELTGGRPELLGEVPIPLALASCGLRHDDLAARTVPLAGTGITFAYLRVLDSEAVRRADPSASGIQAIARAGAKAGLSAFAWDADRRVAHARVFAGDIGVPEDPATGSAALGLGVHLVASGLVPGDGASAYTVEQGAEIGRPSILTCTVVAAGGVAVECRVAGRVAPVSRGSIVPPD